MGHHTLPDAIVARISSIDAAQFAKIDGKIHYQVLPQESDYPHVYITRQGQSGGQTLDGLDDNNTESFVIEVVSGDSAVDDDLITAIGDCLDWRDGAAYDDITVFTSDLDDVSDDYVFQSGDGDALFINGFVLTLYL